MSFRLFVYYCAMCGGLMAWFGWALGRLVTVKEPILLAGLKGLCLGVLVGFGLGVVDVLLNVRWTHLPWIVLRALIAAAAGALGGLLGGVIGQALFGSFKYAPLIVPGWVLTGFLIGIGVGIAELGERILRREQRRGAIRKLINSVLGGTIGGLLGGLLYLGGVELSSRAFPDLADTF